ncbi:hypothetical protein [Nisaea sediminum]|uniref:hypothetical protein n=1 Tax=Nisaea sediminum TaxID=2775867 RepID=UPI001868D450|nr:hypothetical protein [Nisaea sediminum]
MKEPVAPRDLAITFGTLFHGAFEIYFSRFWFFTLVTVASSLPGALFASVALDGDFGGGPTWAIVVTIAINTVVFAALSAVFVYAVVMQMCGKFVPVSRLVLRGFASAGRALITILLMNVFIAIGLLLLIIPGLIMMCEWFVAVPVSAVERTGPFAAMGRSSDLTEGYRGRILGYILVFWLIDSGYEVAIDQFLTLLRWMSFDNPILTTVLTLLLTAPTLAIPAIAAGYAYVKLVSHYHRIPIGTIASAFD